MTIFNILYNLFLKLEQGGRAMLFVVVERGPSSLDKDEIERRCKVAWVAMNRDADNSFKHTDVGGAVFTRSQNPSPTINLKFIYSDRGEEFDLRLRRAVRSQFGLYDLIQTMPTGEWFVDPVWAVVDNSDSFVAKDDLYIPF